jgi:hypothetical protein
MVSTATAADPLDVLADTKIVELVEEALRAERRISAARLSPLDYETDPGGHAARSQTSIGAKFMAQHDRDRALDQIRGRLLRRLEELVRDERSGS